MNDGWMDELMLAGGRMGGRMDGSDGQRNERAQKDGRMKECLWTDARPFKPQEKQLTSYSSIPSC